jgi:hypothetical protein
LDAILRTTGTDSMLSEAGLLAKMQDPAFSDPMVRLFKSIASIAVRGRAEELEVGLRDAAERDEDGGGREVAGQSLEDVTEWYCTEYTEAPGVPASCDIELHSLALLLSVSIRVVVLTAAHREAGGGAGEAGGDSGDDEDEVDDDPSAASGSGSGNSSASGSGGATAAAAAAAPPAAPFANAVLEFGSGEPLVHLLFTPGHFDVLLPRA